MKQAAAKALFIYGECGGYMVLGEGIEDSAMATGDDARTAACSKPASPNGNRILAIAQSRAAGRIAVPIATYRDMNSIMPSIVREGGAGRLFRVRDALGEDLGEARAARRIVMRLRYIQIIDLAG